MSLGCMTTKVWAQPGWCSQRNDQGRNWLKAYIVSLQFEREEEDTLQKVLNKYELQSFHPVEGIQSFLPSALAEVCDLHWQRSLSAERSCQMLTMLLVPTPQDLAGLQLSMMAGVSLNEECIALSPCHRPESAAGLCSTRSLA